MKTSTQPTAAISAETPLQQSPDALLARARAVIDVEIEALEDLKTNLDGNFLKAVEIIENCSLRGNGRVIVIGMGKSGLIGRKIAATLSSTGTPAMFLHPAEGSHGDLGAMMKDDVVIAISNSGETPELLAVLPLIKRFGLQMIAMTGNANSTLARESDAPLSIAVRQEACPLGLAPTSSTTATLALGDTLAIVLLERKGFTEEDFALFHPAGALGKRLLLKVSDVMHQNRLGETVLPLVTEKTPFLDALLEISGKKLGLALVVSEKGQLQGIVTDGDVRRALTKYSDPKSIAVPDIMNRTPKLIDAGALAVSALRLMEEHKITQLVIPDESGCPLGVVHLHDILKTGIS